MVNGLFESSTLPVLEQVVSFTEARHGVLAGNIANLDTPGYRGRDLSVTEFRARLKDAIEQRDRAAATPSQAPYPYPDGVMSRTTTASGEKELATVADTIKGMLRHDDNNTSLEEQITEIAKNQSQHNLALSLMNAQFRLLRAAITERP
jgi:flagellar basal-body rod protein FlgB